MGFSLSILLIAAGAILRWAVTVTIAGVNLETVGLFLFVVGILGVLLSLAFWNRWGGFQRESLRRSNRPVS